MSGSKRCCVLSKRSSSRWILRKGGRLVTSGEECNPVEGGYLTDVGILACDDPYHCVEDPSSRLGGVCAEIVDNNGGAVVDIDQGGVRKAKHIGKFNSVLVKDKVTVLEEDVAQSKEREECTPSVSTDIGILAGCLNKNHVCVKDPLSSLGGTCKDISSRMVGNHEEPANGFRRRLTSCTFVNGTAGQKCSAEGACSGLSTDFISNNIGCGSCNAFGGYSFMTGEFTGEFISCILSFSSQLHLFSIETSSVGEGSCNAGNACRFNLGEIS